MATQNEQTPTGSQKTRRNYKDRVFCKLFGSEEYKEDLLSLFNALNETNYQDPNQLEINTIEDTVYMGMHNDVSCVIDSYMNAFEHQSSINPNMPVRGLMHFAQLYNKYIDVNNFNRYGGKLIKLPTPQYYVLYNGTEQCPEREELKLSDAFIHKVPADTFEWTATVLNVNYGCNTELMKKCKPLYEYSYFIQLVRDLKSKFDINTAINKAVDICIQKGILKKFLTAHKAEVIDMLLTEYNELKTMEAFRRDGFEDGEDKMARLVQCLISDGKAEYVIVVSTDKKIRHQMYEEYGIN